MSRASVTLISEMLARHAQGSRRWSSPAEHVVRENVRVLRTVEALEAGNLPPWAGFADSHESLRDRLRGQLADFDAMVEIAAATLGRIAARMTGAGFGGCTVNLVRRDGRRAPARRSNASTRSRHRREPGACSLSRPQTGPKRWFRAGPAARTARASPGAPRGAPARRGIERLIGGGSTARDRSDVGGSGIKAAVVDVDEGRFGSDRLRVPTPVPSTPDKVSASIGRPVKRPSPHGRRSECPGRYRPAGRGARRRARRPPTSTRPGLTT